ncbi:MAG TPA: 9-O-acetylesterase, partial [Sphingomicrobium sp.]|nr:9-O-acetylesterase [Sphingomicrobium sp.]
MRLFALAILVSAGQAVAVPTLDPLFSDHAVVQRDRPIHVRGRADPGERVAVTLGTASATATTNKGGEWTVTLPPLAAGGPYILTATGSSGGAATASNILIGDVWLCSGQSNMEWPLRRAMGGDEAIAAANDSQLRMLTVPQRTAFGPERSLPREVRWDAATPDTVKEFSALCYAMARELRAAEKVPIGAIDSSWGGTRIRPWIDEASMRALGDT